MFLATPTGKYLVARAEREAKEAIADMKTVSPADHEGIAAIQRRLVIPDLVVHWLADVVSEGAMCASRVHEEEEFQYRQDH